MLFLFAIVTTVLLACALAAGLWPSQPIPPSRTAIVREPAGARADSAPAQQPESLEGVLVAQLLADEISPGQYRNAVEGLAAREGQRDPLSAPPRTGPADA